MALKESRYASTCRAAVLAVSIGSWVGVSPAAAQTCPPTPTHSADETANIKMEYGSAVCTVQATDGDAGVYVKAGTTYNLHIAASVAGACLTKVQNQLCTPASTSYQTVGTTMFHDTAIPSLYAPVTHNVLTTPYSYDSHDTTNTSGPYHWLSSVQGLHVITSETAATPTSCNFPTSFNQTHTVSVNVLTCKPEFKVDNNNHFMRLNNPAPNTVQIFLDPATMSAAASDLDAAITVWNAALVSLGMEFERVTTSCGAGPRCITVTVAGAQQLDCGSYYADTDGTTGVITGNSSLSLRPEWATFPSDGLQRTFMHELGHFVGLDDYLSTGCGANDALMQKNFNCAVSPVAHQMTTNDSLPVLGSVYGTGTHNACGF